MVNEEIRFTEEDLEACWDYHIKYLLDLLNGDYLLEEAREDLKSLIGTKWDSRVKGTLNPKINN